MADNSIEQSEDTASNEDEKILKEAHERFQVCVDAEAANRLLAKEDIEFALGQQWPEKILRERSEDGRPALVVNKIAQQINQVTNDQRQNKPAIRVSPVDSGADIETAKVRQGIIRNIEYVSNADIAYSNAFEFAVTGGFGGWRVVTEYADQTSFKTEARIKQIKNPFTFYLDPFSKEPDGSDAEYGFVFEDFSKDSYKLKFPKSDLANEGDWDAVGASMPKWMPGGSARVAEYFYKEYTPETLCLLNTGESVLKSKLKETFPQEGEDFILPDGLSVEDERPTNTVKIKWLKINATEILEKTEFPGSYIPLIPCYGKDVDIDGKRVRKGMVRDAKDPARMYNYYVSAETEAIALAPRAPFIMADGQVEGYEGMWETANRRNHAYLVYKPKSIDGTPVPPPQRNAVEPAVQAISQARMLSSDDLKATTGIYDAALGAQSNEKSGIAIQRRTAQSSTSNYHFIDNLNRSIRHTGRILNDIIPVTYDTEQEMRILGDEGDERVVKINTPFNENGKDRLFDMSVGKYDVTLDTGPSFQTKRQESAASMLEMSKTVPQIMQVAPDLVMRAMDWPGSNEIADRFKKMLPPQLADDKGKQDVPPAIQAQMQQMSQMVEQLTGKLKEAQERESQKLVEIESKERIEMAKLESQATIELAKLQSNESLELLGHQIAEIETRLNQVGFNQPFPDQSQEQFLAPESDGGMPAQADDGATNHTGGGSPGLPMEGQPIP